jgi:hypothetical protein
MIDFIIVWSNGPKQYIFYFSIQQQQQQQQINIKLMTKINDFYFKQVKVSCTKLSILNRTDFTKLSQSINISND